MLAHEVAPPDVEAWLYGRLVALGGIRVFAIDSAPRQHAIIEETTVQVDVRASSKERARARAYEARTVLLASPQAEWDDGTVHRVDIRSGPAWVPDDDGAPRYVIRATLHYRTTRTTPTTR